MTVQTEPVIVNIGPQHPSTHGVFRMRVAFDGEVIVDIEPVLGYLHRGSEKLAEERTYTQVVTLTDRMDYVASMTNNQAYVLAVEKLAGIEPTPRGVWLRMISAELQRVATICRKEEYVAGEKIFDEGAVGDKFYIIHKGEVRISKVVQGVGEEALAVLKPGAYFGEMALIEDSSRSAAAITNTSTVLYAMDKEDFEDLLHDDHDIAYKLLWTFVRTLSRRLRDTNEKIKGFFAMTGGNQW